jgi:hypothetical protein
MTARLTWLWATLIGSAVGVAAGMAISSSVL